MTSKRVYHPEPVVEPELVCPYNEAHRLYPERFQRHLIKCAQSYPDIARNMTSCRFNQTHVVLKTKLNNHEQECPDRIRVASACNQVQLALAKENIVPLGAVAQCEESWDDEVHAVGYDPTKKLAQLSIAPVPSGLKKADRKEYLATTRYVIGSASGNLPEGCEPPKDTTIAPLPYQPSGGRGRGKPVTTAKAQAPGPLEPFKVMVVTNVPKPKGKRIAAQFSGPAEPSVTGVGRGRLLGDAEDFPPLGSSTIGGRGRPPPGFENGPFGM